MKAEPQHIMSIAKDWYQLKERTAFGGLEIEWSVPLCVTHLQSVIDTPGTYIAVEVHKGKVIAACGVSLVYTLSPPHLLTVTEWLWTGQGKAAARTWQECRSWGKSQGAVLAHCAVGTPNKNKKKFVETYQWRVL